MSGVMKMIRDCFEESNMTQAEFAKLVGVDRRTMNRWLNGIGPLPNLKHVQKMCEVLEVEMRIGGE